VRRVFPFTLALSLTFLSVSGRAEAPQGLALALGLSGADGTVRTQANVKLSVSPAPGSPDHAVAMGREVAQRMPEIRACYGEAMSRSAEVQGRAVFEVEALSKGRARARVASDQTGDRQMLECMRASLARTTFTRVPSGVRSLVTLDLLNPAGRLSTKVKQQQGAAVPVRLLPGGRVESYGATQAGEVQFRIAGEARERRAIEALHRDISARFAGLLDCRRKASRRDQPSRGTITLDVTLERGRVARARPKAERSLGPKAPKCVVDWLHRADGAQLLPAELQLAITFNAD
jgi:hypothetical protein